MSDAAMAPSYPKAWRASTPVLHVGQLSLAVAMIAVCAAAIYVRGEPNLALSLSTACFLLPMAAHATEWWRHGGSLGIWMASLHLAQLVGAGLFHAIEKDEMGHGLPGGPAGWPLSFVPLFCLSVTSDFFRINTMLLHTYRWRHDRPPWRTLLLMTLVYGMAGLTETPALFTLEKNSYALSHSIAHVLLGWFEWKFWDRQSSLLGGPCLEYLDLSGKVIIVTGASSGVGRDFATAAAAKGAHLVLVSLPGESLPSFPNTLHLQGDLADADFAESIVRTALEGFGRIDILVNNAAMPKHKPIYAVSGDEAARVMKVNFEAPCRLALQSLKPMLLQRSGLIINVASFAGLCVPPREAIYGASKAALYAFTRGLWLDLRGSNVHAVAVIPGAIDTPIWSKLEGVGEPGIFGGATSVRRASPALVTAAILRAIMKRPFEVIVPYGPDLRLAVMLNFFAPSLQRLCMAHFEPLTKADLAAATADAKHALGLEGPPAKPRAKSRQAKSPRRRAD